VPDESWSAGSGVLGIIGVRSIVQATREFPLPLYYVPAVYRFLSGIADG
jgi:hypothetical protein